MSFLHSLLLFGTRLLLLFSFSLQLKNSIKQNCVHGFFLFFIKFSGKEKLFSRRNELLFSFERNVRRVTCDEKRTMNGLDCVIFLLPSLHSSFYNKSWFSIMDTFRISKSFFNPFFTNMFKLHNFILSDRNAIKMNRNDQICNAKYY